MLKACGACTKTKPAGEFWADRRSPDGLQPWCKDCRREYQREWIARRRNDELRKCDVRCEDCHQRRHAIELRRHGISRYEAGCRCDTCLVALRAKVERFATARRARECTPA